MHWRARKRRVGAKFTATLQIDTTHFLNLHSLARSLDAGNALRRRGRACAGVASGQRCFVVLERRATLFAPYAVTHPFKLWPFTSNLNLFLPLYRCRTIHLSTFSVSLSQHVSDITESKLDPAAKL